MDPSSVRARPRVFCLYSKTDEAFYQELGPHLQRLEEAGLVHVLSPMAGSLNVHKVEHWRAPGWEQAAAETLQKADLLLVLVSADLLVAPRYADIEDFLFRRERQDRVKVIPVYVRPVHWRETWLARHHAAVPTRPVTQWDNRDDAWQQVVVEIRRCVLPIEEIFKTTGQPGINFVEPAQMPDLVSQLRNVGRGLVVEGPSGIGKTTAVKHALESALRSLRPHPDVIWLDGKKKKEVARLSQILAEDFSSGGYLVIDDFHRLEPPLQREVANLIKILADDNRRDAKVTLIGINPVGVSLVQGFHDLTGRFASIYMGRQPDDRIEDLIRKGEDAANVTFSQRARFVQAAAGSFYTAQILCYQACLREGINEVQLERRTIETGPSGYVTDKVQQDLASKYHEPLCAFAALCEQPPPQGACLVLLWLLHQSPDQSISLQTARYRFPQLASAFDWLTASNLWTRIQQDSRLKARFYYRRDAAILSVDDPQLEFYLRNLNWEAFIRDTGHVDVRWDPIAGPQIGERPATAASVTAPTASLPESYLLHLSDLHISSRTQASLWAEQLLQDLASDVRPPRIDGVVVSGDIANRATLPEYQAAGEFLQRIKEELNLSPQQMVLVPGNHDLSWEQSRKAYTPVRREDYTGDLEEGQFIDGGAYVELRNDEEYRKRFAEFSNFYHQVRLEPYPLDDEQQATLHFFSSQRLLLLGLNSAWALDHHYRSRAGINLVALGQALRLLRTTPAYADCLKVAIWHHPISSDGEDRIKDSGFLELLAQAGFRLALHGHIHKAQVDVFHHDRVAAGRRIDILAAGTFGAPVREWVPGYPLQYQLLQFSGERLRVLTRRRRQLGGAWEPDACWLQGPGQPPLPYYEVDFSPRPTSL
jgi:calcineurin-like phosphoesterase family protein